MMMCAQRRFRSDCASESSLGGYRRAKDDKFLHVNNEDSGQTLRIHRAIQVFVESRKHLLYMCWIHLMEKKQINIR